MPSSVLFSRRRLHCAHRLAPTATLSPSRSVLGRRSGLLWQVKGMREQLVERAQVHSHLQAGALGNQCGLWLMLTWHSTDRAEQILQSAKSSEVAVRAQKAEFMITDIELEVVRPAMCANSPLPALFPTYTVSSGSGWKAVLS